MTLEEFKEKLSTLGIEYNSEILLKLEILANELIEYNNHTNLTAIKDIKSIYLKHYYDSLTIVKVVNFESINNLIDVGTGAGFPGLVLKIFFPKINITLLDSNNKKAKWLEYIANKLNLKVNIIHNRIENFATNHLNEYDLVTSRAVSNLRVLSEICLPLVKVDGYFVPLKGNLEEELSDAKSTIQQMNAIILKQETFYLYNGEGLRNILLIAKTKATKSDILRSYDKIIKKPLKNFK